MKLFDYLGCSRDPLGGFGEELPPKLPSRTRWQMERDAAREAVAKKIDKWMPLIFVLAVAVAVIGKFVLYPGGK